MNFTQLFEQLNAVELNENVSSTTRCIKENVIDFNEALDKVQKLA